MVCICEMQILQDRQGDTTVVAVAGRLDSTSAPSFRDTLAALDAEAARRIVLDLGGVDYISSAGLHVLFELAKRMRLSGGALAICALGDHARRVFELAGYVPYFTITATRAEAVAHVRAS